MDTNQNYERRRFLQEMLTMVPLLIGCKKDKPTNQQSSTVIINPNQQLNNDYETISQKLHTAGFEFLDNYTINKNVNKTIIFLPDLHERFFHEKQKERINQINDIIKLDALGLEGIVEEINEALVTRIITAETKSDTELERFIQKYTPVENAINSIAGVMKKVNGEKQALEFANVLEKLIRNAYGAVSILGISAQERTYLLAPGYRFVEEYINKISLLPLEDKETYKPLNNPIAKVDEMIAEYRVTFLEMMFNDISKEIKEAKIFSNQLKIINQYIQFLKQEIESKIPKELRRKSTEFYGHELENLNKEIGFYTEQRNSMWANKMFNLPAQYKIIGVIGGSGHIEDFFRKINNNNNNNNTYNIITINTGIPVDYKGNVLITN